MMTNTIEYARTLMQEGVDAITRGGVDESRYVAMFKSAQLKPTVRGHLSMLRAMRFTHYQGWAQFVCITPNWSTALTPCNVSFDNGATPALEEIVSGALITDSAFTSALCFSSSGPRSGTETFQSVRG